MNDKDVKLKAKRLFYCKLEKRIVREGSVFYATSDRAIHLVSGSFADVIERPAQKVDKVQETKVEKAVPAKPVVKPVAKPKPITKKAVKK